MQSWADKVRGTSSSASNAVKTTDITDRQNHNANSGTRHLSGNGNDCIVQDVNDDGDDEGWETVQRGRKMHGNHTRKVNKTASEKVSNVKTGTMLNDHLKTTKTMNGESSCNGHVNHQGVDHGKDVNEPSLSPKRAGTPKEISNDKELEALADEEEQASLSDIEHEKALSAATEQEESLSRQIEEWQNQMIASVIEHEESLTKEIAAEEELVTQINGESESPMSDVEQKEDVENIHEDGDHSLNCSATTNGDSVSAFS